MSADSKNRWHLRRFLFVGYVALFLLVGGLGGWAAVTRIAGAVIALAALLVPRYETRRTVYRTR